MEAWRDQTSLLVETELVVSEVEVEGDMIGARAEWRSSCVGWASVREAPGVKGTVWCRTILVLIQYVLVQRGMWLLAIVLKMVILEHCGRVLRFI